MLLQKLGWIVEARRRFNASVVYRLEIPARFMAKKEPKQANVLPLAVVQ